MTKPIAPKAPNPKPATEMSPDENEKWLAQNVNWLGACHYPEAEEPAWFKVIDDIGIPPEGDF